MDLSLLTASNHFKPAVTSRGSGAPPPTRGRLAPTGRPRASLMATALAHTCRAHGGNAGSALETPPLQGAVQGAPWVPVPDGELSFPARGHTEQRGPAPRGVPPALGSRLRSPLSPKGSQRSRFGETWGEESSYVTHLLVWGSTCGHGDAPRTDVHSCPLGSGHAPSETTPGSSRNSKHCSSPCFSIFGA